MTYTYRRAEVKAVWHLGRLTLSPGSSSLCVHRDLGNFINQLVSSMAVALVAIIKTSATATHNRSPAASTSQDVLQ